MSASPRWTAYSVVTSNIAWFYRPCQSEADCSSCLRASVSTRLCLSSPAASFIREVRLYQISKERNGRTKLAMTGPTKKLQAIDLTHSPCASARAQTNLTTYRKQGKTLFKFNFPACSVRTCKCHAYNDADVLPVVSPSLSCARDIVLKTINNTVMLLTSPVRGWVQVQMHRAEGQQHHRVCGDVADQSCAVLCSSITKTAISGHSMNLDSQSSPWCIWQCGCWKWWQF